MQEILKVTDVNFERSDFSLNNISFKLYSGDIVGLIGENGAGKTTLFNVIFKNLEPSNGEISFGAISTQKQTNQKWPLF